MIIFLYGQDSYRSRKKLNEIIEQYKKTHKSGLNLRYFEDKLDFEDLKNELQTVSMFEEKKMLVLRNVLDSLKKEEGFIDFLKKIKDSDNLLIFYEEKDADDRTSLAKFLKKEAKSQQFDLLTGAKLKSQVKEELEQYQAKIDPLALEKLIEYVGSDFWQMANEIKKLVNYAKGRIIEVKDIELLIKPKIEPEIFKTIDAVSYKTGFSSNRKRALELIHNHMEKGDHPLYLLSMINFQFRNILLVKDLLERSQPYYTILKATKLHPFVVKKSYEQANKFTLAELKSIYRKIFQTDLAIKTGRLDPALALELLIISI